MFNWTHRWFNPEGKLSADAIVDAFCSIFFEGMQSGADKPPPAPA